MMSANTLTEICFGVLAADLITGVVHWLEDNYATIDSSIPFIRNVALDNEMHHYFPRDILAFTHLEHMQITSALTALVLGSIWLMAPGHFKQHLPFYLTLGIICLCANILHRFLHERDHERNVLATYLQKSRVLSSREEHQAHHRMGGLNYCIITPWLNPVLDGLGVWAHLEAALQAILGVKASPKRPYDGYTAIHTLHHELAALDRPPPVTRQAVAELKNILIEHLKSL